MVRDNDRDNRIISTSHPMHHNHKSPHHDVIANLFGSVLKYGHAMMEAAMDNLTISKTAKQAGVGVETVRFYERKGLIEQPLKPRDGGYRIYSDTVVQQIRFIRHAQELGFSLREIEELLSLRADPNSDCADVRTRASEKLLEVERKIEHLKTMGSALIKVIEACPSRGGLEGCSIIESMEMPVTDG